MRLFVAKRTFESARGVINEGQAFILDDTNLLPLPKEVYGDYRAKINSVYGEIVAKSTFFSIDKAIKLQDVF